MFPRILQYFINFTAHYVIAGRNSLDSSPELLTLNSQKVLLVIGLNIGSFLCSLNCWMEPVSTTLRVILLIIIMVEWSFLSGAW